MWTSSVSIVPETLCGEEELLSEQPVARTTSPMSLPRIEPILVCTRQMYRAFGRQQPLCEGANLRKTNTPDLSWTSCGQILLRLIHRLLFGPCSAAAPRFS